MQRATVDLNAILKRIERTSTRSSLFWWFLDHYAAIERAANGRRINWRDLSVELAAQGLCDVTGKTPSAETARKTWQRVRKEKKRLEEQDARERAEREARRAADPRRNMPSQFPKGEYGAPLATLPPDRAQPADGALAIASPTRKLRGTTPEQRARGLQLSTAEGMVVTTVSRVYKTEAATSDFMFEENGMIVSQCPRSSALRAKQEFNRSGQRHVNDRTVEMKLYGNLGLRLEDL